MPTQYASAAFLAGTVDAALLRGKSIDEQNAALAAASEFADSYLASRYALPLVSWSDGLRRIVCSIAAYDIGGSKAVGSDGQRTQLRIRYEDAIAWLESVAAKKINPPDIVDSSSPPAMGSVRFGSNCPRGW